MRVESGVQHPWRVSHSPVPQTLAHDAPAFIPAATVQPAQRLGAGTVALLEAHREPSLGRRLGPRAPRRTLALPPFHTAFGDQGEERQACVRPRRWAIRRGGERTRRGEAAMIWFVTVCLVISVVLVAIQSRMLMRTSERLDSLAFALSDMLKSKETRDGQSGLKSTSED